ncbi:hypothetical protein WA1_02685 [Scytonema hofmannii PCC 7110]|uniref:Uncharacterized protein n=1 Tax=Scytonema hofmannii PCC 7110 TaxID=128403 RepID=A0A139XH98_9CYAN|nr:hypothetical protein WA1_02685 [Scytonema hofmannii PCC 7110]
MFVWQGTTVSHKLNLPPLIPPWKGGKLIFFPPLCKVWARVGYDFKRSFPSLKPNKKPPEKRRLYVSPNLNCMGARIL